jgi:hypothetical protein
MKEITKINDTSVKMSNFDIIIYGSIRDIENDFFTSFLNLDIISEMFNKVYIIIFENDSRDKTRELLQSWYNTKQTKIKKHIILKDNLDELYPLRATRLAYCRNYILNYIIDNNLHLKYQYAIHCDLDDRFWGVDFNSIKTCFQYNLSEWDVMTCVNKNRTYYDFWALRCEKSWFNINIFSCDANNTDYNTKTYSFETLIKNTTGLIPVTSSFNGFGIYKLTSLIDCRYNARYKCEKCNGKNRGCLEDNDHIGLHKQIINNNGKIFINNQMFIQTRPKNCILYQDFIKSIHTIKHMNKPILQYLLINNLVINNGKWLVVGLSDGDDVNIISNYCSNNVYVLDINTVPFYSYLNKNVIIQKGPIHKSIYEIQNTDKNPINFLYINFVDYSLLVELFHNIYNKITKGTIIVFNKLINFKNCYFHNLKALYEFLQEYEIKFEWLYIKEKINENLNDKNESVSIRILENNYFNTDFNNINYSSVEYEKFNWIFYSNKYSDLNHIKTKEDAYLHWINYGYIEGRISKPENEEINEESNTPLTNNTGLLDKDKDKDDNISIDSFDWETYIELNTDLKELGVSDREVAYNHWINHGKKEGRLYSFDWCTYIKNYNLINQSIDTKSKAIEHWLNNGKPDYNNKNTNYDEELFDWKYYVETNSDLSHIKNSEMAWNHWITYGKNEGRQTNNFKWTNYLLANNDLVNEGINTESLAIYHWINHGKKEKRKMC